MNKRINFEDSAFILNNRIRMIANTIILDADPDLFLEKTLDDMDFIDTSLTILLDNLLKNEKLIDRSTQFYNLMATETKLVEITDTLTHSQGSISVSAFPTISDNLQKIRSCSAERQQIIRDSIDALDDTPQDIHAVSSDELNALLRDV